MIVQTDGANAVTLTSDGYYESGFSILQSVAPDGAGVRFTDIDARGFRGQFWTVGDLVSGETGILADDGPVTDFFGGSQSIHVFGSVIEGTEGTAIDLGSGDDLVSILDEGATIIGDVLLGDGDDELELYFEDTPFEDFNLRLVDTLFDGGDGFDTLDFSDAFDSLSAFAIFESQFIFDTDGDVLNVSDDASITASVTNFEEVAFSDVTLSFDDLLDQLFDADTPLPADPIGDPAVVAPVPLPASALLLLAGLGGLGVARRSKRVRRT